MFSKLFVVPSQITDPVILRAFTSHEYRLGGHAKELREVHGNRHQYPLFYLFTFPFVANHDSCRGKKFPYKQTVTTES